jgi:hypothetical protein
LRRRRDEPSAADEPVDEPADRLADEPDDKLADCELADGIPDDVSLRSFPPSVGVLMRPVRATDVLR